VRAPFGSGGSDLALTVRRQGGVVIEYAGEGIILDPTTDAQRYPAFVSHAHADHAAAFRYPSMVKYSTEPTRRLLQTSGSRRVGDWHHVPIGGRVKIGDIEVRLHNAGHILGSAEFEAATPEGTILYTGDFSLGDSYTMKTAEPVRCDILVIETTFGAPMFAFPKRSSIALDIIRWATLESIPGGRIPTLRTDSIGNAQEVISIFNRMTKLPVVTARSVTRASDVYREYGYSLDYVDADSPEGQELLDSGKCALITPKGSKLNHENLEVAFASGWAAIMKRRDGYRPFPLSDHADFRGLLSFIRLCHPKRVLTFHGGAMTRDFADYVSRRLGIDARPLTSREETLMGTASQGETRRKACCDQLLYILRIPGFLYMTPWLVKEMARRGFGRSETEAALQHLIELELLAQDEQGFRLA